MNRLTPALLCAVLLALVCAWQWRRSAKSLVFLVIFEGALRKWLFPSLASELYLLKDVVLVGALAGWSAAGAPGFNARAATHYAPIGAFTLFGLVQVFNPAMGSVVGGLFGLKAYVLWSAYPLLLGAALRTRRKFEAHVRAILWAAVPICLLAVVQAQLPPDNFLNVYAREATGINTFGDEGIVRVTGTFPFLSGYANFLIFVGLLLLPAVLHSRRPPNPVLSVTLSALVVSTAFMTGSRWPVFFLGLFCVGHLSLAPAFRLRFGRSLRALALPAVAAAALAVLVFPSAITGWTQRVRGAGAVGDTIWSRSLGEFAAAFHPAIFSLTGDGIGSTNNAAHAIGSLIGMPVRPSPRPVEAEPGRVMAELGVVGFLGWYGLRVWLLARAFAATRRLRHPLLRSYALAAACFLGVGIMAPVPFDTTLAAFFWLAAGFPLLLSKLAAAPRRATATPVEFPEPTPNAAPA